jgi:hypothetical protein
MRDRALFDLAIDSKLKAAILLRCPEKERARQSPAPRLVIPLVPASP